MLGVVIVGLPCLLGTVAQPAGPVLDGIDPDVAATAEALANDLLRVPRMNDTRARIQVSDAPPPRSHPGLVISVSWQPAHCETRPDEAECVDMTGDRFDASHFALHGLWPQPRHNVYCDVDDAIVADDRRRRWHELPEPDLSEPVRVELAEVMPAVQVWLHRHAWWKHGTCYDDVPAEKYFADSLTVMRALNASSARDLFAASVGRELTRERIREEFDRAFGAGAGARVSVACVRDGDRRLIVGFTVELGGEIADDTGVADLIFAAPPTDPGCGSGVVDPVGHQ